MKVKRSASTERGEGIAALVGQWVAVGKRRKMYADKESEIKSRLMEMLDEAGEEDEKGHKAVDFDPPVAGVRRIQRQKRVAQVLDLDTAETLLGELGIWDECIQMVPQVDEDAILGFAYGADAKIPESVIEQIYTENESFAFVPVWERK